jgi:hypothetical protein
MSDAGLIKGRVEAGARETTTARASCELARAAADHPIRLEGLPAYMSRLKGTVLV